MGTETVESQIDIIKILIETCRDAQAGYLIAAEHAKSAELRAFFSNQSMERARFSAELERVAKHLGEAEIAPGAGIVDRINRAWLELKHKLGAGDTGVLETVEAAASQCRSQYQQAVQSTLPGELKTVIDRQAESVFAAYDQICALREMGGKAA